MPDYTGSNISRQSSEGDIDQANQFLRSQPFYLDYLRSIGQDPSRVHLNDDQRKQLERVIMQNMPVEESGLNVDPSGNIDKVGHKLRNTLIAAGIAAGGYFAAPAIAGALAGGGAAGGAGAAGAASGGGAATATGLTAGGLLPSAITVPTAAGTIAGGTGIGAGVGGAATGGSILGKIASSPYLKNIGGVGQGISAASSAAGNTRRADIDTNVGAQSAFNSALLARAAAEDKQRNSALRDVYAAGYFRDQPRSPYNPAPVRGISQNYLSTLGGLEGQAMTRLQQAPQYGTNQMPELQPYATKPGVGERIGNYAGPILSTIGAMYGQRPSYGTPPYFPRY